MQQRVFTIAENAPVARETYRLRLAGDTAAITAPGQFVDIRLAGRFLRRPVSVCSWSDGALTLYYKVAGAGTAQLSTLTPGTELDLLVGLGNGFDTAPAGARPLLVGGGVGASPLCGLAQQLVAEGRSPLAVLGFRTAAEVLLADAFCALGIPVTVVTEDGTMGARGFVTEALPEGKIQCDLDHSVIPNVLRIRDTDTVIATFEKDGFTTEFQLDSKLLSYKYKYTKL